MAEAQLKGPAELKRAVVVVDWPKCFRACLWVQQFSHAALGVGEVKTVSLAESPALLAELMGKHILVFNFDSINGDQGFGSGAALGWVQANYPGLLQWVSEGGILIMEGQTLRSIPTQASYDALFGHREFFLSGPAKKHAWGLENERVGVECRVCKVARGWFRHLDRITCTVKQSVDFFFPGPAQEMVADLAHDQHRWPPLYRGWFTRRPVWSRQHYWIPLIETDPSHSANHPVLMGARLGKGALFVSTMMLAGTDESDLIIESLLRLGAPGSPLMSKESAWATVVRWIFDAKQMVSFVVSAAAGYWSSQFVTNLMLQILCWILFSAIWLCVLNLASRAMAAVRDFFWD